MKKVKFLITVLAVIIISGCTSTNLTTNRTGWSDYSEIVVKDYQVVGHVRVEAEESKTVTPFGINTTITGSTVTYDMLLNQAIELGADDIINVRIDQIEEGTSSIFGYITGYTKVYKYYGNAVAIKYIESADYDEPPAASTDHPTTRLPGSKSSLSVTNSIPFFNF